MTTAADTAVKSRDPAGTPGIFQDKLDQARDKLSEVQETLAERSGEAMANTEKYVGDHPWKALAVAGTIGIVLGMLIGRR
jgi:ElaB/YqjD/DUF883 family membrane-anchored ribosome-binding protein